jgi:hypothetical protein
VPTAAVIAPKLRKRPFALPSELRSQAINADSSHAARQKRRLLEVIAFATVLLTGLYAVFSEAGHFWKTHLPGRADNRLYLNVLLWHTEALRSGKSWPELWQMPTLYPERNMLATSDHMLGEWFFFAPIYLLTGEPILSFNAMMVLGAVLNFLAAYLVARRLLRSATAALLSAVLFTFGSYRLYHILHLQLWLHFPTPLLFLAAIRTDRPGWRWPVLAGVCLASQFYLGIYLGYFAGLMIGIMLIALVFYSPWSFLDVRFLCRLALGGAVAGLLLFPLAGPYREAAQRWGAWSWSEPKVFLARWHDFFSSAPDGERHPVLLALEAERAVYWGYTAWILLAIGVIAIVQQSRQRNGRPLFWPVACVALTVSLCCLCVNHFHSYRFLFEFLPGFNCLRVPGRLALLALWPCGLLSGIGLTWLGALVLPQAPRRRAFLSLGVVFLVFLENYHPLSSLRQHWSDARCPGEEFYAKVVGGLPPGPIASVPFRDYDPYSVAGAIAAGWRPTLNVYTGRLPHWFPALRTRTQTLSSPAQAAQLMGEMRLRDIRYLILDKTMLPAEGVRAWSKGETSDGRLKARIVYDDPTSAILDLNAAPPEACLVPEWASASSKPDEMVRGKANARDGSIHGSGSLSFEPTMPLRPGRYEVTFEYQVDSDQNGRCEIDRLFFDQRHPERLPHAITLASAPLQGRSQLFAFRVPEENGPEPIFQFRVVYKGKKRIRVQRICITPASDGVFP